MLSVTNNRLLKIAKLLMKVNEHLNANYALIKALTLILSTICTNTSFCISFKLHLKHVYHSLRKVDKTGYYDNRSVTVSVKTLSDTFTMSYEYS